MIQIYFQRQWHVHIFNRLSFYWEPYLTTVKSEYWKGHSRKRIARFGDLTLWIRDLR